ncbi:MAG: hypothetical protein ACXAEL_04810 [Candidatus Hodarchaeales archaeon]|jgi:hypothetical protein
MVYDIPVSDMTIPPDMVGKICDEYTQQVMRRLFTRLTETELWRLKRLLLSNDVPRISEEQALDYLQMIDERLEAGLKSPYEKLQKHEQHLKNMTRY